MNNTKEKNLILKNGANIAVIGGGPSGSFFSYFAIDYARKHNLDISIDIIEAKEFGCAGISGCNQCGGVVSESLIQMLSKDGIELPPEVIRKGIETYTLHIEQGSTIIEAPIDEQKIATMFRGLGPKGSKPYGQKSFDDYLLELCTLKGVNIILDRVTQMERKENTILIKTKNNFEKEYDLVVGATGLSTKSFDLFRKLCPSYIFPQTTRAYISEISLDEELINEYFGNSMHVFLLNIPNIKFGALIPKAKYVTLVLLGIDINKEIAEKFMNSEPVKKCFPENFNLNNVVPCQCYPLINIKGAKSAYSDRVVIIGDSATSKLYKNGIGAAYITGKAAAKTAIIHGISEKKFKKYYEPICINLKRDNNIGKYIFKITTIIQKTAVLKRAVLNMVINEQHMKKEDRNMSSILWDTFTGSASYKDIFARFFHPRVMLPMTWNTILAIVNKIK